MSHSIRMDVRHHKMDGPQGDVLMDTKVSFKVLQNISPAAVIYL